MSERERVIAIIAEVLEIPQSEIGLESRFIEDLGVSSLQLVDVVWRLEEVFQLPETPPSKFQRVVTVQDLIQLVDNELIPSRHGDGESDADAADESENKRVFDVAFASDHAGVVLKTHLAAYLRSKDYLVADLGPQTSHPVDYPDYSSMVTNMILEGKARFGVLVCGSGIGMSMAANRKAHIRAALVSEPYSAQLSRKHNNANVICFGARLIGSEIAEACLDTFLNTAFDPGDDGRHRRRVDLFDAESAEDPET